VSDQVLLAIIAAIASTIASTVAAVVAVLNARKISRVERQTNGMIGLVSEQSRAAGFESGRAAVRSGDRHPDEPEGSRAQWQ